MPPIVASVILEATILADAQGERTTRGSAILLFVAGVSCFGVMDGLASSWSPTCRSCSSSGRATPSPFPSSSPPPVGWPSLLRCERPLLQAVRGLLPLLAGASILLGLRLMSLADATVITFAAYLELGRAKASAVVLMLIQWVSAIVRRSPPPPKNW
jgi:hypothetical protein